MCTGHKGSLPDIITHERHPLAQAMLCLEFGAVSKLFTESENKLAHALSWLISSFDESNFKLVRSKL